MVFAGGFRLGLAAARQLVQPLFAQGGFEVQTLDAQFAGGPGAQFHPSYMGGHLELVGRGSTVVGEDAAREDGQVVGNRSVNYT